MSIENFPTASSGSNEENNNQEQLGGTDRYQLAKELFNYGEVFQFTGITSDDYESLKVAEKELPPGFVTPIDTLLERFRKEGLRIVLGKNQDSGNIFAMPAQSSATSDDIKANSIFPRHLQVTDDMDDRLKKLIQLNKNK